MISGSVQLPFYSAPVWEWSSVQLFQGRRAQHINVLELTTFRETCFVDSSATLSALSTFCNRKRPIETHDCIADSLTSTCFKRPVP